MNPVYSNSSYLNSCLLSQNNIPLPVENSEFPILFLKNIKFSLTFSSFPSLISNIGSLFLTSSRIIYIPSGIPNFLSFAVPLKRILSLDSTKIKIICENGTSGMLVFSGNALLSSVFFPELKKILSKTISDFVEDFSDDETLYSDILIS